MVRLLIDDLNTLLRDASTPQIRGGLVAAIDAHPNIQVRLFNPWTRRNPFGRAGEMVTDLDRLNQRIHRRKPLIEAGVSLYETRHDAAVQRELADTTPVRSEFMGLHVKAIAVDGDRVMIGSMNLDPRSDAINTEMAVIVESKGLAVGVGARIRRDMQPVNSWRVELDAKGALRWVNSEKTVTQQPARNFWQRVEDIIFMAFPREYY